MARTTSIDNEVFKYFTSIWGYNGVQRVFVFESNFRRTKVTGHFLRRNEISTFDYYFKETTDEITIFDRDANQPMWYAMGICATVIFMFVTYLVVANSRKRRYNTSATSSTEVQWHSQSFPTSTEI